MERSAGLPALLFAWLLLKLAALLDDSADADDALVVAARR
jgi:hypothetical protein